MLHCTVFVATSYCGKSLEKIVQCNISFIFFLCSSHGTARNPYNIEHFTGGSSSGSGAAVAAGTIPLNLYCKKILTEYIY